MSHITKAFAYMALSVAALTVLPQIASAQVNLTPFQPSGWTDKIVVSTTTGTHTDDALTSSDTLYVDWSVINNGSAPAGTFYVALYLDDVQIGNWSVGSLNSNYYVYVSDRNIGTLSVGTHTLKVVADSTNLISETDETDNQYVKTINVTQAVRPNLAPSTPAGWSDKMVISTLAGTNTDASTITSSDTLYLDWAVINNGTAATAAQFTTSLYLDGALVTSWNTPAPLNTGSYATQQDYVLGKLWPGSHTLRLVADSGNNIAELNETDNQYSKTFTVADAGTFSITALATNPKPPIKNQQFTFTITGTGFDPATVEVFALGPGCATDTSCVVPNSSLTTKTTTSLGGSAALADGSFTVQARNTATGAVSTPKGLYVASQSGTTAARALVLLVDFSDRPSQTARSLFDSMMFGDHPSVAPQGSFRDFYKEISYQTFNADGAVNNATIAWIRLPQTATYYANGCYGLGSDPSGQLPACSTSYPQNAQKMVEDAVIAAKNMGLDFGPFDADQDGYVDALFVVHAGSGGEASGNRNDIWSHAWATQSPVDTGSKNAIGGSVSVSRYTTEPEYFWNRGDITIGVFAHEYGHTRFGLPDLYDTDYSSKGVGSWSLMAGGNWNGSPTGASPAHMDAWSKWASGFITPAKVTSTLVNEPIQAASSASDVYQVLNGSPSTHTGEYFLVENRQKSGFDSGLPSSGLLIWHIDDTVSGNYNENYPGCSTCTGHYKVQLVQADNLWELEKNLSSGNAGDPYPGSCGLAGACNTAFTATTSPNSNLWSGASSGVSITSISPSSATMKATIIPVVSTGPTVTINQAAAQADPTSAGPISFTVVFSEAVTDFTSGEVSLSGSAGATTTTITGSGTTYNVAVSGMTAAGSVTVAVPSGVATGNVSGLMNQYSTSTDNTVTFNGTAPTVTINQAAGQADPASQGPINFTVTFSESVTGFSSSGVSVGGTAPFGAKSVVVTGSGTTYNVAIDGMSGGGTVVPVVSAAAATSATTTMSNQASSSTDNTVTYWIKKRRGQVVTN